MRLDGVCLHFGDLKTSLKVCELCHIIELIDRLSEIFCDAVTDEDRQPTQCSAANRR